MKKPFVLCWLSLFLLALSVSANAQQGKPAPYTNEQILVSTEYTRDRVDELVNDVWSYRRGFENLQLALRTIDWYKKLDPHPSIKVTGERRQEVARLTALVENDLSQYAQYSRYGETRARGLLTLSGRMGRISKSVDALKYHARTDPSLTSAVRALLSSVKSLHWQINEFEEVARQDTALLSYGVVAVAVRLQALRVATDLKGQLPSLLRMAYEISNTVSPEITSWDE